MVSGPPNTWPTKIRCSCRKIEITSANRASGKLTGPGAGVPGGDLDVAQVHARIERRGDEGVTEHVRVCPRNVYPGGLGQLAQAPGGGVPVHPGTAAVEQNRAARAGADRLVDRPADRGRQQDQDYLGAVAAYAQHAVAVFFAEVG